MSVTSDIRRLISEGADDAAIQEALSGRASFIAIRAMICRVYREIGLPRGHFRRWTADMERELERLCADGLSSREIAKAMGVGRNAVLGKLHYMGNPNLRLRYARNRKSKYGSGPKMKPILPSNWKDHPLNKKHYKLCPNGHEMTVDNRIYKRSGIICLQCAQTSPPVIECRETPPPFPVKKYGDVSVRRMSWDE